MRRPQAALWLENRFWCVGRTLLGYFSFLYRHGARRKDAANKEACFLSIIAPGRHQTGKIFGPNFLGGTGGAGNFPIFDN
jgi:hypothetical protein